MRLVRLTCVVLLVAFATAAAARESTAPGRPGSAPFNQYCSSCHGIWTEAAVPPGFTFAPGPGDLTHLARRYGYPLPKTELLALINPAPIAARRPMTAACDDYLFHWMRRMRGFDWAKRATALEILYFLDTVQETN